MSPINIFTLPPVTRDISGEESSLQQQKQIEAGLLGSKELTVPGSTHEDHEWAFKRSVPTVVLYDEQGLRLYDRITSEAPEYYLFPDELNLLKTHGEAIARWMGFPGQEERERWDVNREPAKPWKPARWGDAALGKWNNGVNGEEGLGGGFERGWDVVELGAGALRKTAYLLTALSSSIPHPPKNSTPLITYHPLDLSFPELHRVLREMDEAFGEQLKGKVDCIGLHGDYEAGLQFIRDGKLATLREVTETPDLPLEGVPYGTSDSILPKAILQPATPLSGSEACPTSSPTTDALITPGPEMSPLPSAITDDDSSEFRTGSGRSWSPVEGDVPEPFYTWNAPPESEDSRPLHLVFLGSSLGNFPRETAAPFLRSLPLRSGDTLLLGLDGRPAPGIAGRRKVEIAYNDPAGHTRAFEEHGWDVVRESLGLRGDAGVEFVGRYNEELGRHEAYFRSKERQTLHLPSAGTDFTLEKGELLNIEWSYKYSHLEALDLFKKADLRVVDSFKAPESEYRVWLLERPSVRFITPSMIVSPLDKVKGVPKWDEWLSLWKLWDHPTFLDIHLTRMTNGFHTEPEHFKDIFERGIDPDVDDPNKIHVPTAESDWPTLDEILGFRDRVRARLQGIYKQLESGKMAFSRHIGRVLFMTFEHEAMHAETLLYMLIQSESTRPPAAVATPQWDVLAHRWADEAVPKRVIFVEGGTVALGHHDLESEDEAYPKRDGWEDHEYGWDNEHPAAATPVKSFKVDSLPITNDDYKAFLGDSHDFPASWIEVDGKLMVRTLYGPVDFDVAGLWPLMASKIEIDAFAKSKGGRLPTEAELRFFWAHPEGSRPAGELSNVGVKNWHPVPPAATTTDNAGKTLHGHSGGVWEWTSSEFAGSDGFVPSVIYPGYSADFFDGKHFVVLGGSYLTIPSIAGRKSFRNWYQANYRFSFIGGRVAYDV